MTESMDDILHPGDAGRAVPEFPEAPPGWTPDRAREQAASEGIELGDDHWLVVRALQEYRVRNAAAFNARELKDALDEKFNARGGIRFVYGLFPGGPVAQGCRIAGLPVPAGAEDKGFGSVM